MAETVVRSLSTIAREIRENWGAKMSVHAAPYVEAMLELDGIHDRYHFETADGIVRRFLVNAASWRGETARRVKAELKAMLP